MSNGQPENLKESGKQRKESTTDNCCTRLSIFHAHSRRQTGTVTHTDAFTQSGFYAKALLQTADSGSYAQKLLHSHVRLLHSLLNGQRR